MQIYILSMGADRILFKRGQQVLKGWGWRAENLLTDLRLRSSRLIALVYSG
jgi:hypothetical protein